MRLEAPPGSSVMREKSLLRLVTLPRSLGSEITHTNAHQVVEAHHLIEQSSWEEATAQETKVSER